MNQLQANDPWYNFPKYVNDRFKQTGKHPVALCYKIIYILRGLNKFER